MTIAVDMGRKATKTNKQSKENVQFTRYLKKNIPVKMGGGGGI